MTPTEHWRRLAKIVPGEPLASAISEVRANATPEPYRGLLFHSNQMTATMERFHRTPVDVAVLAREVDGSLYRRAILLLRRDNGTPVQFALAEYDLDLVSPAVRNDILGERTPLGRVLTNHGITSAIKVEAILRIVLDDGLARLLNASAGEITFGRTARIEADGKPAFLVIEVSAPLLFTL